MLNDAPALDSGSDEPKTWRRQISAALPVALTALATAFAAMTTSELQRAMFWRSYAAQDQAKATSQWTLAGFKRDRALMCQSTAAILQASGGGASPNPFTGSLAPGVDPTAAAWLAGQGPPPVELPSISDETLMKLLAAIRTRLPEPELQAVAGRVRLTTVNAVIEAAEQTVEAIDTAWKEPTRAATNLAASAGPAGQTARFELETRRYLAEAHLNQGIGFLYEARVAVSSATSLKHQRKSANFFYAMLAAQIGGTISALALARQRRSVLWGVAGVTGLVALGIGAWVYLSDLDLVG